MKLSVSLKNLRGKSVWTAGKVHNMIIYKDHIFKKPLELISEISKGCRIKVQGIKTDYIFSTSNEQWNFLQ